MSETQGFLSAYTELLEGLKDHPEQIENFLPQLAALEQELMPISARGDNVQAVCDFGKFVFGVEAAEVHQGWIREQLENKRVVIVSPPESAKTTYGIVLMTWWIGKHPEQTNAIFSAGEKAAYLMAKVIADTVEKNPRFRKVFPSVSPDTAKGWSREGYWVIDTQLAATGEWEKQKGAAHTPTLYSGGVGSSGSNVIRVTGRLLCDDIHDRESKRSDTVCADTVSFLKDTILNRLTEQAFFSMNQTRWNPKDSVDYLDNLFVDGEKMYTVFVHPARNEQGESYWPENWPEKRLARKEVEVGDDWQLVWMCDANAARNQNLKAESLRSFPFVLIKKIFDRYIGVDFAQKLEHLTGTKTKDPDNMALAVWVNCIDCLVLEDGYVGRPTIEDAEEIYFQWVDVKRPVRSGIEINSRGSALYTNVLKRMNTRGGFRHPVVPITATQNKLEKIKEWAIYFSTGQCKLSEEENQFIRTFKMEWSGFGLRGVHDDTLDAAYNGWKIVSYLMPTENAEQRHERMKVAQVQVLTPFQQIENYYGVGR